MFRTHALVLDPDGGRLSRSVHPDSRSRGSTNLSRELQMQIEEPVRGTTEKRTVRWLFEELYALVEPSLPGPDA